MARREIEPRSSSCRQTVFWSVAATSSRRATVNFHAKLTRVVHRELTRLRVMVCGSGWGQGMCDLLLFFRTGAAELALKRKLSFPVSSMWQRWVSLSRSAVVILASPKTLAHSLKLRLVVMTTLVRS